MMPKGFLHIKKYDLIYARVPKVANSSIKTKLTELVDVTPIETLKPTNDRFWRVCTNQADFMNPCRYTAFYHAKFSFSFIRDPFDRIFSCYVNKILVDKGAKGFPERGYKLDMSFDDFVAHTCSLPVSDMDVHTQPQEFLITDVHGRLPKFVGLLENITRDWSCLLKLFAQNKIPVTGPLPIINARKAPRLDVSKQIGSCTWKRFNWVYGPSIELHTRLSRRAGLDHVPGWRRRG